MGRFSFSFHKRGNRYYVQFWNPDTKKYTTAKSTGATTKNAATGVVMRWLDEGIPFDESKRALTQTLNTNTLFDLIHRVDLTSREADRIVAVLTNRGLLIPPEADDEQLVSWLLSFWDYDSSPYVADKLAHGQRIGRRRCQDTTYAINNHWVAFFKDMMRSQVTREHLRQFGRYLADKVLSAKTINNTLSAGTVALHWAFESGMIKSDPTQGLRKFSGETKKRGILTDSEVADLFSIPWSDPRARLGSLLAAGTGLRAGEVLGLRYEDIGQDRLHVRHSWSNADGLKATKTGDERVIPLTSHLRAELLALAEMNPHKVGPGSFVFWSVSKADRPMDFHFLLDSLKDTLALMKTGPDATEEQRKKAVIYWKERNIVFHSWRHRFAAFLADNTDQRTAMLATGHNTEAVFEEYAKHTTEENLRRLTNVMDRAIPHIA
jgi:integrase